VAAARILGVKDGRYQTVQSWLANRVPSEYCPTIERETRARGDVVTCEDLRDDLTWVRVLDDEWPEDGKPLLDVAPLAA
jgi:DNA-binding transcriptional regulator YdaS (Cro superfamily)